MPQTIKPDPLKTCNACGSMMKRKRYNGTLESMNMFVRRRYCDQKCMAKGQEKEICSSTSHSRSKSTRSMKESCEMCGSTGYRHVHHKDENPRNNDPSNLQTLCVSCHALVHSPNFDKITGQRKSCLHCSKESARAGLCNTHLSRLRRYGDPCLKKFKIGSEWHLMRVAGE